MIAGISGADGKLSAFGGQRIVAMMSLAEAASMRRLSGGRQSHWAEVAREREEQQQSGG